MKTKKCSICNQTKPISLFFSDKRKKDGLYPHCKMCHKDMCNKWENKNVGWRTAYNHGLKNKKSSYSIIYTKKKYNARVSNISFTIEKKEFIEWYSKVEQVCSYCGLKQEDIPKYKSFLPNTNNFYLSLDRIDNNKGYSIDNICLACTRCNLIKSNFFSYEEMKQIGINYVKPKWY